MTEGPKEGQSKRVFFFASVGRSGKAEQGFENFKQQRRKGDFIALNLIVIAIIATKAKLLNFYLNSLI